MNQLPKIFVRPNPRCRKPIQEGNMLLKKTGEYVPTNSYWLRRVKYRDVLECNPPSSKKSTPKKTTARRAQES